MGGHPKHGVGFNPLKNFPLFEAIIPAGKTAPDRQSSFVMEGIFSNTRKWLILMAMTGSLSMIMVDQTVVSVALPRIQRDLGMSSVGLQWVVNAYLLAIAAMVAIGGRVGDTIGRVKTFIMGVVLFSLSSAACGFASTASALITARAFQGIGAAFMQPASSALVLHAFPREERGRAMAIYAGVAMAFLAVGPLMGGAFTQFLSWRWAFFINLPVAVVAVFLTLVVRPQHETPPMQPFDFPGMLLILSGMPALIFGLEQSMAWGWQAPMTWVLIGGGLAALGVLVWRELGQDNPLIEIRLFHDSGYAADAAVLFCNQFVMVGQTVFSAIYMQKVLGFPPFKAGIAMLAVVAPVMFVAQIAGRMYDRGGARRPVSMGLALVSMGLFLQIPALLHKNFLGLLPGMFTFGIGNGLVMTPAHTDALSRAPQHLCGQAAGLLQTMRQLGGSVGMVILWTIVHALENTWSSSGCAASGNGAWESLALAAKAQAIATSYGIAGCVAGLACIMALSFMQPKQQKAAYDSEGHHV